MKLKDKVIVITGASDGIGKQIALKLTKEGGKLALIARDKVRLEDARKKTEKLRVNKVKVYPCDICQTKELERTVKSIVKDFSQIDVLINNAGIWQKLAPIEKIEEQVVDDVINVNLTALIHNTRLFLPYLKKQKEAAIINISSKSGIVAQEGQSVYTASKYGVHGFTEVLKADLKGSNVRVAGIYQSGINTRMFAKAGDHFPTDKFTEPADLAEVIIFMLSRPNKIWLHEVHVQY